MATTPTRDAAERARLSKQAVVERALALADSGGLDALTIRRLAQDLGVTPMALYWHFRSKEELIGGLADRIWSEIGTDVDAALPWSGQLRGVLESLIAVLRAHPASRYASTWAARPGHRAARPGAGPVRHFPPNPPASSWQAR